MKIPVIFNEFDRKRFNFIKVFIDDCRLDSEVLLYNYHAFRLIKLLKKKEIQLDYIFVDLPYIKVKDKVNKYDEILSRIDSSSILKSDGTIIIQHFKGNRLSSITGRLVLTVTKRYGTSCLSIYKNRL